MAVSFKNVLVPTDLSETAACALQYGTILANAFNGMLHVLSVVEDVPSTGGTAAAKHHRPVAPVLAGPIEEEMSEELKAAIDQLPEPPRRRTLAVREGSPFVEIVRYARENGIDVIVIGTHGRGPVAHLLLGSVADNVIRQAPCPVLTIRHHAHQFVKP